MRETMLKLLAGIIMPNKGDSGTIYKPPFLKYRYDDDDDDDDDEVSNLKIKWRMRTCVQASMQHAQMNTRNQSFSILRSRAHAFYQQHFSHVSSHMCPFICPYMLSSYVSLYVSAFYQQHTQKHARAYTATYQRHPQKHARTHARTHVRARTHTNSYIPETPALLEGSILKNLKLGVDDTAIIPQSLF